MYQGKFSNKNSSENVNSTENTRRENTKNTNQNVPQGRQAPPQNRRMDNLNFAPDGDNSDRQPQKNKQDPALQFDLHFDDAEHYFEPDQELNEAIDMLQQPVVVRKHLLGSIVGGIIFYILLIGGIAVFWLQLQGKLSEVTQQLSVYEELQPTHMSQVAFSEHFGLPDWEKIFEAAGSQISEFEGKEVFAQYMRERIGDQQLHYQKAADLEDKRIQYDVYSDRDRVASFTMKNGSQNQESPDWQIDGFQVYYEANESYQIRCYSDHVLKVNGVPLDKSFLIQKKGRIFTQDLGEDQESIQLPSLCLYEIDNFLMKPEVTIEDGNGQPVEVSFDENSRTFSEPDRENVIPDEAKKVALDAVRTYCEFMIKKASRADLSKYFMYNTDTYKAITASDLTWIQREKGHDTTNEKVYDYVSLGENAFSIRVSLTWQLIRQDGSVKESPVDVSLIFEKDLRDNWMCSRMSGKEFLKPFHMVRVRFMHEDNLISTSMVDSTQNVIFCPNISPGDGTKLVGWVTVMQDEAGNDYYQRVLVPDPSGNANVPDKLFQKPVDLFPVYDKK